MTNSKTPGVGSTGGLEGTAGWLAENEDSPQPKPSPTPRVDWVVVRSRTPHPHLGRVVEPCECGWSTVQRCTQCGDQVVLMVAMGLPACDHALDTANSWDGVQV